MVLISLCTQTTKFLSGHNQIIGGIVITNRDDIRDHLKHIQMSVGAVPSPFDCWLCLLGVKTLSLRMEKCCDNALKIAQFLSEHSAIQVVKYPGLESHPEHEIAKKTNEEVWFNDYF